MRVRQPMNGDNQNNTVSTEDRAFYLVVKSYHEDGLYTEEDICHKLNISRTTFKRWLNGRSCPHSAAKDIVYDYLLSLIEKKQ